MSQAISVRSRRRSDCLHLSQIDWSTYTHLLRVFAERPDICLTYDRGELEIMSPRLDHDDDSRFLGDLVFVLTEELRLPLKRGGSTTLRRRLKRRGIEPDECYWVANASRMVGRRRLDLRRDPPPDLVIEVDVTHSSLDRLAIYAALGVPEIWRLEGDTLTFLHLESDGQYAVHPHSRAFPRVTATDLLRFVQQAREAEDENAVTARFREWVRQRHAVPPVVKPNEFGNPLV